MSKTERRLEWADQLEPLINADSEMGTFIDNGERPQTSRLVRWRANVRTVLDAILKDGPDAPKWPEYNRLLAEAAALRSQVATLREALAAFIDQRCSEESALAALAATEPGK